MAVPGKVHFIGVAGSGMSALAQFHVMGGGGAATGSDRSFDKGASGDLRARLEACGVRIFPQDGSALDGSHDYVVSSAAVEADVPDLSRAGALHIALRHRAQELARHVGGHRSIAVAGTSGKSTVAAMVFHILEDAGLSPSLITGGELQSLRRRGYVGNALRAGSDLLVIEADESDGTITQYHPWLGVLLNMSKDHKSCKELGDLFSAFRANCSRFAMRAGCLGLEGLESGSLLFGRDSNMFRAEGMEMGAWQTRFLISGVPFHLPLPGIHNVENAEAAAAACGLAGVDLQTCARALAGFEGICRRFQRIGSVHGITVVDDYAHNPAKVAAALAAAHIQAQRVLGVFQLHGFAPARLMREEFVETLVSRLLDRDVLWMPEIYYAGGRATRDISARDITQEIAGRDRDARYVAERAGIIPEIVKEAEPGDMVLIMGARDPSLPEFAREVLDALGATGERRREDAQK